MAHWAAWGLRLAVLAGAVFALDYLCVSVPKHAAQTAPIWLANAVVLATLLCSRRRRWPLIAAVGALAELAADLALGQAPSMAFGFSLSNAFEICAAGVVLSRLARRPFERWRARDALKFGAVSVLAASVSGLMAMTVLWLETASIPTWRDYLTWLLADALGLLVLTPCLLILARSRAALRGMGREAILPFAVLFGACALSFGQSRYPIQFLPAAALMFLAWRLRTTGAALGLVIMDAIAIPMTMMGRGPFAYPGNQLHDPVMALQTYMAVCFFMAVPVSAQSQRVRRLHTQLRQALADAREDARKVTMAGEVAKLGYWRFEIEAERLTWSPQMYRIFGRDEDAPLDVEAAMNQVHPTDRERSREGFQRAIELGESSVQDVIRLVTPQGELRYAGARTVVERDASGRSVAVFGVMLDKTEATLAERARLEAESRYRVLAENSSDLIVQGGLDRRFSYVSPASRTITGYDPAELIGKSPVKILHPDDIEMVAAAFNRQVEGKGKTPTERIEFRIVRKDGAVAWMESRPTALVDPDTGACIGVSDAVRDISARRALEDELRAARIAAEAAARVKGEFLANMSHELRTPLTSVVGFTRLVAEQTDLAPLTRDYIERVSEASRSLLCTVNDILDFSKLEAGQAPIFREPISPVKLAKGAMDLFLPQAAAKDLDLALETDLDEGLHLELDPDRLRQILLNLIGNAVKFTDRGKVKLQLGYDNGKLQAAVIDTGAGIPPDRLGLLFQRFSQIDGSLTRSHGGTGLGLAICKGLVEAMDGQIGVESRVDAGSTFRFSIPARESTPIEHTDETGSVEYAGPGLRVLVVDDHAANRELASLFLAGVGAEMFEAAEGAEAVELARRWPFDVILMDLRMPGMDGAAALAAIRSTPGPNDGTPILAFTADTDSDLSQRLQRLGFQGVVSKPVEPAALIRAVLTATADIAAPNTEVQHVG
ncbi:MAG TPA: PAS domain-containing protein [Caulobacteraceae bacterium]|nr:PAS domain-containing protein [Caulobacteraceae bacterium]